MTTTLLVQWSIPAWAVMVAALVVLAALIAVALVTARSVRADAQARIEVADARAEAMQARLEELAARLEAQEQASRPAAGARGRTQPVKAEPEYLITSLDGESGGAAAGGARTPVPAGGLADQMLREGLVQTASFVHGVRRALSPEVRNRIRFEMKREVKRSRKARKVEVKEALREYRARHRAGTDEPSEQASEQTSDQTSTSEIRVEQVAS